MIIKASLVLFPLVNKKKGNLLRHVCLDEENDDIDDNIPVFVLVSVILYAVPRAK